LQQVQPIVPQELSPDATGLVIEQSKGEKLPPSAPFEVKLVQISGNLLFDTAVLHGLVADAEGKILDLQKLDELAARITDYYHNHNYSLSRAFIPEQAIQNGVVQIEIIEARYGKVILDNRSPVTNPLLEATLSALKSGQPVGQAELDRILLLISDIPGVEANAMLKPGETVGTSDLTVGTTPGSGYAGNMYVDDYGGRYTGRARVGGAASFYNPFKHGDSLGVSALTSGNGLNYGGITYDTLLNGVGTHAGASYTSLHYVLGDTLASINGHGTAQVTSLWLKHPFVRSREINVYGQAQYEQVKLRDHIDMTGSQTDRHLDNLKVLISGDVRDALFASDAFTAWNIVLVSGKVSFDNAAAQTSDASAAKTRGSFAKLNVMLSRQQSLNGMGLLYFAVSGQWANGNLDSSQKMTAGGPYSVRAYDMSTLSGDTGYTLTSELRHDLGTLWAGKMQAVAFFDGARVTVNKFTWSAGVNAASLTGAGVGFNWLSGQHWAAKAYIATPLGAMPSLLANRQSVRAWFEISKGF
jgi:hemolysin activation/secretion protein